MRTDSEFQLFLRKWRNAFRAPSPLWDGNRAVAELKRARYERSSPEENARRSTLKFIQCEPGYGPRPREMLEGIVGEVNDYKKQKFAWKKERLDAEVLLAGVGRRLKLRCAKVSDPTSKSVLATAAAAVEQQRLTLRSSIEPARRSPLGAWERVWPRNERIADIKREIGLDTRLQIQSAKMLRTFLHRDEGVSLRTIARLVVLVYLVAGLASEKKNQNDSEACLWLADSERAITWRTVEDKLRGKGIR